MRCSMPRTRMARGAPIIEDIQRQPLAYGRVIMGSMVLGRKLAQLTASEKHVGVLLPNANAVALTLFGLMSHGKVPAMLNFSTGAVNMAAACVAAQVRTIVTSRRFIEAGEMQKEIELLGAHSKIIYLEDVRAAIGRSDKIFGLKSKFFPHLLSKRAGARANPNDPAVILFTSGSEGVPKGVVLSHRNLTANWQQAAARIAFAPDDVIFNALPVFHAFGLLGGLLLPLLSGVRTFLYPSPLHYKIIPELVYDTNATAVFGTDTFLTGYAKNAHPYDFYSVRLVVAGAERVRPKPGRSGWRNLACAFSKAMASLNVRRFFRSTRRCISAPARWASFWMPSSTASSRWPASTRAGGFMSRARTSCWAICAPTRRG